MLLRSSPTGAITEGPADGALLEWSAALGEWTPRAATTRTTLGTFAHGIIPPGAGAIAWSVVCALAVPTAGALVLPIGGPFPAPLVVFPGAGCTVAGAIDGYLLDTSGAGLPAASYPVVCLVVS